MRLICIVLSASINFSNFKFKVFFIKRYIYSLFRKKPHFQKFLVVFKVYSCFGMTTDTWIHINMKTKRSCRLKKLLRSSGLGCTWRTDTSPRYIITHCSAPTHHILTHSTYNTDILSHTALLPHTTFSQTPPNSEETNNTSIILKVKGLQT